MIETTQIGEWQKISDLGSGAFGIVSLWKNNSSNDFVAIKKCKFMLPSHLTSKQKERWKKEVEMINCIKHPNIIGIKEIPPELKAALMKQNPTKLPLMPMEYCKNGNLRRVLCKWKNISGLEESEVRAILEDVSKGLEHLHKLNITHRDIKPENIVIQNSDERLSGLIYKIIDLGYAKELNDSVVSFVGTLHYLAPEIFDAESYNKSVDYWSLGLLTFEIICGVLPFLPQLTPYERFLKIKDKAVDDICIYLNYSGRIAYSKQIKKENFISMCLKQNIEIWLRHVLQYDKDLRSQPLSNGVGVFTYLQDILKKTIINVISLSKLELYSYEVNDSTLLGTLKDWICRDIKTSRSEIVLLIGGKLVLSDDSKELVEQIGQETNIYVLKINTLIVFSAECKFPKLVKEAITSAKKFDKDFTKALCAQTIYFIKMEYVMANYFKTGFVLYMAYLCYTTCKLKKIAASVVENLRKLLVKVEGYNEMMKNNVCDIYLGDNFEYKDCLSSKERLVASLERCIINIKELGEKIDNIEKKKSVLESCLPEIEDILIQNDQSSQYSEVLDFFEKKQPNKKIGLVASLAQLVSSSIKCKYNLSSNKKLCAYSKLAASVLKKCDQFIAWLERFSTHITDLCICFEQNQMIYQEIIKAANNNNKHKIVPNVFHTSLSDDLLQRSSLSLAEDNRTLRNKLEELILSSIQGHENYSKTFDGQIC